MIIIFDTKKPSPEGRLFYIKFLFLMLGFQHLSPPSDEGGGTALP